MNIDENVFTESVSGERDPYTLITLIPKYFLCQFYKIYISRVTTITYYINI